MKRLLYLLIVLFPFLSVAQKNNTYVLEGKTNKHATFTLQYSIDGRVVKNTAEVTNGEIKLTGTIDTKVQASLMIAPHDQAIAGSTTSMAKIVHLWLEPGHIKISDLDSTQKIPVFSGTSLNDETNELAKEISVLNNVKENKQKDSLRKGIVIRFIRSHPNSLLSLTELKYSLSRGVPDINIVEPLFNGLSTTLKASPLGKEYLKRLAGWKIIDIGSTAPNFSQPDQNGKPVKLSDFKGKYVLLDFWASWCHPCRDEHPDLIKQYNLYKNKGFIIMTVSIDGGGFGTKASWLKAIAEDQISDWVNISDLKGDKKNDAQKLYSVGAIPQNFLIDPEGKIIGIGLRGTDLDKKLKEIFDKEGNEPDIGSAPSGISGLKTLTLEPTVRTGKLANGFTYYIRKNTEPKNRVLLYLANKAGSILENNDQRGLAHFLEHMNFDGTTHFPKYELVNYLQKSGIRFGADLNAYTSFDETVYQLPLPSDDPTILKNGIQIMRDWAKGALLDSAEIYKELPVVLEEKRLGKGAGERMRRQYLPILFNGSRYAERLPIGVDSILNNFKPKALRDFYNDWYRPDLQALIVVGDIDVNQMENTIKSKFSDLKNPENEKVRKIYTVPLIGKNQFVAITDNEQTKITIEIIIKHRTEELKTASDYRNYIIRHLFNSIVSQRIAELSANKSKPPFVSAGTGISELLGGVDTYSTTFVANTGDLEMGFKAVWRETERIKRFGFTQSELDRAKNAFLNHTESAVQEADNTNSNTFINEYLQNFLKNIASPGIIEELNLTKLYLPGINLENLQSLIKVYIRNTDRDIVVLGPEKDKSDLPNEQKVNQWITEVAKEDMQPYNDTFIAKNLLNKEPLPGKIIGERKLNGINSLEWTLSNGAKVILKKTDFSANFILFNAFAPGGSSVYNDADYLSASNTAYILDRSGIGNFNSSDLSKFFSGKDLFSLTNINDYQVSLQGGSTTEDMESLFRVTYAKFMQPRYDKGSFEGTIASLKSGIKNQGNDPETIFQDTIQSVLSNHNFRKANLTAEMLAGVNLDKAFKIYNELLAGNASNFVFCFSGPIDTAKMRPFVEKYIASLPTSIRSMQPKDLGIHPSPGKIIKQVNKGFEPKASANLVFSSTYHFNAENNEHLKALKEIIQINLINRLRKEESGVYSPSVSVNYQKIPDARFRLSIRFDCAPENLDKLIKAALDEVNKIRVKGPIEEDVEKFKAEDSRTHDLEFKEDFTWLQYIQQQILNHENLDEIDNYNETLQRVTVQGIRQAANKYLSGNDLIEFKLLPENFKP